MTTTFGRARGAAGAELPIAVAAEAKEPASSDRLESEEVSISV
jgi:hypothetical protein